MHILQSGEINGAKGLPSRVFDRSLMSLVKLAAKMIQTNRVCQSGGPKNVSKDCAKDTNKKNHFHRKAKVK